MYRGRDDIGEEEGAAGPRLAFARSGSGMHWRAAMAALLCNAAMVGALASDLSALWPAEARNKENTLKTFALAMPPPPMPAVEPPAQTAKRSAPPLQQARAPAVAAIPTEITPAPVHIAPRSAALISTENSPIVMPTPPMATPRPEVRQDGKDDTAWTDYQRKIWAHIKLRTPRGMHIPGETLLEFTLDTHGMLTSADISRPSGNVMLDRLALRTLREAAPFPQPPEAVRERGLRFTIRFSFR